VDGASVRISELTTEQVAGRLNDILLLMTLDGQILDVNDAALKAYGYALEELRTMNIRDLRTPEEQERAGGQMRTAALEGILFESEHRCKDGTGFPVQVRSAQVELEGQPALLSVIRDIRDSRRMQDALRERNARLAVIVEGAGVGTWEWNVQSGDLAVNEVWAQIIGYTLDELAPVSIETWEKYAHPDDLIRSGEMLDLHFAGELPFYDFECRMRHKDGYWVWVHDRGRVVTRTDDGEPLIMVGTHTDITENKRVAEELHRERRMLTHAEAVAHIGSWRMSLADRVVVWSDETYQIFGLDRETYQGDLNLAARDAVHPDDLERFMAASNAAAREGEEIPVLSAVRIIRPDGTIRWILGSAEEELDDDGRVVALLGFAQDVTEIVEAQAAIEAREATTASLLDAITESAFLMASDGTILAANRVVAERVGGSADADMIGKNVYDFLDPETGARRRAMVEQVLATVEGVRFEDVRNGRALVNSVYPVSGGGEAPRIAVFGYDITELRDGEAALRQSERWLRESQRVANLGHFVYDIESDVWEASPAIRDVLGVDDDFQWDFEGWMGRIHSADQERIRLQAGSRLRDGKPFDFECRIIRQNDGAERWVHSVGRVDREEGPLGTVFGIIQDITERKLAQLEVEQEKSLLAQIEAVAHLGTWHLDFVTGKGEWSDEYVKLLGFNPGATGDDEIASFVQRVHPDDRSLFEVEDLAEPWGSGTASIDFRIVDTERGVRWLSTQGTIERDESGVPVGVRGVLQDMTGRKLAEIERFAHLEEAANIDRLTGLHNRRGFDLVAGQAIAQALRAGQGVGLIYCDLDYLKEINDEFGHEQGDRALHDAASILAFASRSADAVGRIGGDEFIVLAVGGDSESVSHMNERLQEGFEFFNATNERPYQISVSTGTAWCEPGDSCDLETLRVTADANMYAEKMRRRES